MLGLCTIQVNYGPLQKEAIINIYFLHCYLYMTRLSGRYASIHTDSDDFQQISIKLIS